LKGILLKRLGDDFSVVDDKALVFASRKIANSGGDARNLLHVMSEAIAIASKSLSEEQLKDTSIIAHIVKLPHVMKASAGEKDSMINTIKGLCGNAKSVLCIAVALGEAGNAWKIVSASNLQKYCAEASTILDDWSRESFKSTIEILTDAGLIHEAEVDEFEFDETEEKRYKLGVQMEDVEIAMNKILLTEGSYYKGLVDYVKENDIEQKGCSM
jgi:Cdc6-like AAA superfamily ATPase